jgi:hypothetical protein
MSIEWTAKAKCDRCHRYEKVSLAWSRDQQIEVVSVPDGWKIAQRPSFPGDMSTYGHVNIVLCPDHGDWLDDDGE